MRGRVKGLARPEVGLSADSPEMRQPVYAQYGVFVRSDHGVSREK
jgi:hypothetical protein